MRKMIFVAAAIVLLASAICSSCRTVRVIEQVPVEVHDTVYQKNGTVRQHLHRSFS